MVLRSDGTTEAVPCTGTLLGLLEDVEFEEQSLVLAPGELALFFTDGLTEARAGHELFGVERILEAVARVGRLPAWDALAEIHAAVEAFQRS